MLGNGPQRAGFRGVDGGYKQPFLKKKNFESIAKQKELPLLHRRGTRRRSQCRQSRHRRARATPRMERQRLWNPFWGLLFLAMLSKIFFQKWLLITPVYPSETCPLGPIFWGNLGSDRPQVLPEDGPQRTGFRWVNDHYTDHCLGSG